MDLHFLVLVLMVIGLTVIQIPKLTTLTIEHGMWRYVAEGKLLALTGKFYSPAFGEYVPLNPFAPNLIVYLLALMYKLRIDLIRVWHFLVIVSKITLPIFTYLWLRKYDKTFALLSVTVVLSIFSWKFGLRPHGLINLFFPLASLFVYKCLMEKENKLLISGILSGMVLSLYLTTYIFLLMYIFSLFFTNLNKEFLKKSLIT